MQKQPTAVSFLAASSTRLVSLVLLRTPIMCTSLMASINSLSEYLIWSCERVWMRVGGGEIAGLDVE